MNGVMAPPQRAASHTAPCARARSLVGSQPDSARVTLGKQPASPAPKSSCTTISEAKPHTRPVSTVNTDHSSTTRVSALRAPMRSPSQPPGISRSA